MTEQILVSRVGDWGVLTLNNPKAFNALNAEMISALTTSLTAWRDEASVRGVILKSDHEKAFCAGGDIRWLYDNALVDPVRTADFFRAEYALNSLIHHYPKPYVSLINGICMGGGVGISMSSSHLVVSARTKWAMPETGIGMVPDVGGTWYLGKLAGGLGPFLGLTGTRLDGADCVHAGIADHLVQAEQMNDVEQALCALTGAGVSKEGVSAALKGFEVEETSAVGAMAGEVDQHFVPGRALEDIISSLNGVDTEFAAKALGLLARMSPTLLKITQEAIARGRKMSFDDCLRMEFNIVARLMEGPDFIEGVRALIVDKDNKPAWSPDNLAQVSSSMVNRYFEPLGEHGLVLPG